MTTKKGAAGYSPEVRERTVSLMLEGGEHLTHWAAINSVAAKIGCTVPITGRHTGSSRSARCCQRDRPVEFTTLEWVDWFNNRRRLKPIGDISPDKAGARYYAQTSAAQPKPKNP